MFEIPEETIDFTEFMKWKKDKSNLARSAKASGGKSFADSVNDGRYDELDTPEAARKTCHTDSGWAELGHEEEDHKHLRLVWSQEMDIGAIAIHFYDVEGFPRWHHVRIRIFDCEHRQQTPDIELKTVSGNGFKLLSWKEAIKVKEIEIKALGSQHPSVKRISIHVCQVMAFQEKVWPIPMSVNAIKDEVIKFNDLRGEVNDVINSVDGLKGRVDDAEKYMNVKLGTREAIEYWRGLANNLQASGRKFFGIGIGVLIVLLGFLGGMFWAIQGEFRTNVPTAGFWHATLTMGALVSILIYLVRILIKLAMSKFHLSSDSREREMIGESYLSLMAKNPDAVTKEAKVFVINALFARSSSGLLKEEGIPGMPGFQIPMNMINGKRED